VLGSIFNIKVRSIYQKPPGPTIKKLTPEPGGRTSGNFSRAHSTRRDSGDISMRMILPLIVASFGSALLLTWGLNWLALIPWRRSAGQHWTERARRLHPVRRSSRVNLWFLTLLGVLVSLALAPQLNPGFAAVAALAGALLGGYPLSREIYPEVRFLPWLHLVASSLFLLSGLWGVLLLSTVAMPANFGPITWAIGGGVLLVLLAFLSGFGVRLMRWLRLLQPAPENLQILVGEISQKMGVPVRATWVLSTHLSNAAVLPHTRQLIFTSKLLATHPDEEIKAICAHELGHLSESRKAVFIRTLVGLSLFPLIFLKPVNAQSGLVNGCLLLFVPLLVALIVGLRLGRRMEKRADRLAVESRLFEPVIYARALERLYQVNAMPAVMPRRSIKIHPDLYDRMLAAGVTPDFPKPAPAKGLSWTSFALSAALVGVPAALVFTKALLLTWQTGGFPINP
jgi:Zn-dependent protease with chaperone function